MLYDSTKSLLQSILRSLETGDEARWDDRTESGNACLYEMHQMSGPAYKPYRSSGPDTNSSLQTSFPGKLHRAIPHVKVMVVAIRHRDRARAIESARAALAEMNYISPSIASARWPVPAAESSEGSIVKRKQAELRPVRNARASSGN